MCVSMYVCTYTKALIDGRRYLVPRPKIMILNSIKKNNNNNVFLNFG